MTRSPRSILRSLSVSVCLLAGVYVVGELPTTWISLCAFFDAMQRLQQSVSFIGGDDVDCNESFGPRAIHRKLVRQEPAVERERTLEGVEALVGFALKTSAPQAIVFALSLCGHSPQSWPVCAFSLGRTVTGSAKRLMKPSASLGL